MNREEKDNDDDQRLENEINEQTRTLRNLNIEQARLRERTTAVEGNLRRLRTERQRRSKTSAYGTLCLKRRL